MFWRPDIVLDPLPRRVTLDRGEWTDPRRHNRAVPYKIYVPDRLPQDQTFPVILWSHGLGGSRDGAGFLSRFIASYGYIIVHLTHPGTDTSLWEGKEGHPWDVIKKTHIPRHAVLNRYKDIPFVLQQLREMQNNPDIAYGPYMDLTRLGMSGHSFGAMTTQIMAGQRVQRGKRHYNLHQPDFKAGILYSPVPSRKDPADPGFIYGGIKIPLLHMTGTDDESPLEQFGYSKRVKIFQNIPKNQGQMLLVLKNGDHMVFNGSRGGLGSSTDRARHEEVIQILSMAWWDWHLKGDQAAQEWLSHQGSANGAGGVYGFISDDASLEG